MTTPENFDLDDTVEIAFTDKQLKDMIAKFWGYPSTASMDFTDISSELHRTYRFADMEVTIDQPLLLHVSAGGHRIFDCHGASHYVPKGWRHLTWTARDGYPPFVK